MNNNAEQRIDEIKNDLIQCVAPFMNSSISPSKNFSQENVIDLNNTEKEEGYMDCDDVYTKPEQISSNNEQNFNNNNIISQSDQTSQPLTTDNTNTDEQQQMNALEYCRQLMEKFNLIINTLEPALVNLGIPVKHADDYLKSLPIPSPDEINLNAQDPLSKLSDFVQTGIDLLPNFRQICNTNNVHHADPIGEELNETSDRSISAPSEHNGSHLNRKIQAPKEIELITLSKSLSQLLTEAEDIVRKLELVKLEVVEQPKELWKTRTINCLKEGWCTAIQGRSGTQRHYIGIKWTKLKDCNPDNLFVFAQLLSHNNHPHPSKILVPPGTTVKQETNEQSTTTTTRKRKKMLTQRPKLDDLIIDNTCGFDCKNRTLICPVTLKEYIKCQKNLQVIMFSLYKTSGEITDSNNDQNLTDNRETDEDEENYSIEEKLRKLCKIRICLCERINHGKLVYVSDFVDTELIEESKSCKPLAIDKVTPEYLCECGNETITVTFNTDSEKSDFAICLNNIPLDSRKIRGVTNKQLSFKSIPRTLSEQDHLEVMVSQKSISETIKQNYDPYDGLCEIKFPVITIKYVEHSNNPHEHQIPDAEFSIQSTESPPTQSYIT